MKYELLDTESGNLVERFDTLQSATDFVLRYVADFGFVSVETWILMTPSKKVSLGMRELIL